MQVLICVCHPIPGAPCEYLLCTCDVRNSAGRILNFIFSCCDSDATSELAELMMKSRKNDCSVLKDGRRVCGAIDKPM